jgi:hypothetical protein
MKTMNHVAYPKTLKSKTVAELRYIARDAREAVEANPTGENAGYYADEISYAAMELKRRGL